MGKPQRDTQIQFLWVTIVGSSANCTDIPLCPGGGGGGLEGDRRSPRASLTALPPVPIHFPRRRKGNDLPKVTHTPLPPARGNSDPQTSLCKALHCAEGENLKFKPTTRETELGAGAAVPVIAGHRG